jgi:hypothetical protein
LVSNAAADKVAAVSRLSVDNNFKNNFKNALDSGQPRAADPRLEALPALAQRR